MKPNPSAKSPLLQLDHFLPYRLSVLANTVSGALARLYADRFNLTIPEWRVMAVMGLEEPICAQDICGRTAMDKVQVSRAIARMLEAELVSRTTDSADRRRAELRLTAKGRAIYQHIVPAALDYEQKLAAALDGEEQAQLDRLLAKLQARAGELG